MQLRRFTPLVVVSLLCLSNSLLLAQTKLRDRVTAKIDSSSVAELKGGRSPRARAQFDRGAVVPSFAMKHMVLSLQRSREQEQALARLLADLQNPASPKFHQWLTPEQFAAQFGVSENDYNKTVAWLQSQGFTITDTARSRTWIAFDGSAAQVSSAFRTQIHQYLVNGKLHYANASDPAVPAALSSVVGGIRLHDFKPRARAITRKLKPNFTSDQSGNHFLTPDDFATIYDLHGLYNAGIDGTGQKIAVMGQTSIVVSNVTTFRSLSGLPANNPTIILNGPDPGVIDGDDTEAYLDIEWAGAVARKAQIIYVNSGGTPSGAFDALKYAIDHNTAPVLSISYGDCEPNFAPSDLTTIAGWLQEANAQGQTVIGPSGDEGAADCDYPQTSTASVITATHGLAVDIPASFPYTTAIGGTTFNEGTGTYWNATNTATGASAKSYIPEIVWNDTVADIAAGSNSFAATGGGKSVIFSKPNWQVATNLPADDVRFVPDISFAASVDHDGYLTCIPGFCTNGNGFRDANNQYLGAVGGTSAGVPVFAGVVALINQKTGQSQGNLNATLYAMAASTPAAFHDITNGDNKVPCTTGTKDCASGGSIGYSAGIGYDMTTGLGTVDVSALVNAWTVPSAPAADFTILNTDSTLTLTHGTTGTVSMSFYGENGFSGTLNLTCAVATSLGSTTCSVPATVTPNGAATVTIKASSTLGTSASSRSRFGWEAGFAAAFGFVLAAGRRPRKRLALLTMLVIIGLMAFAAGCGGGGSSSSPPPSTSTTPLTGTVTVTATNGTVSHSSVINLTVN